MRKYKQQVSLLLKVLPEIGKETCFAMHGGTAINLFVREMPRLSVDIDLTYIPLEDREQSLSNISEALNNIKSSIEALQQGMHVTHHKAELKLMVEQGQSLIKVEVNQIMRGVIDQPSEMTLCDKAQNEFDAFCTMQIVPTAQLFGGKICAALDRQHPRDLFDVKYLLDSDGFDDTIKRGFIFCLLSSNRPIHEMLQPHKLDQKSTMENQFEGMTDHPFSYEDFEKTRDDLIHVVQNCLSSEDKKFLLSFVNLTPDWGVYHFEKFPAVQWKLRNLRNLQSNNPAKFEEQINSLREVLGEGGIV